MQPRTPFCEFALRLDQVHLGTEVVMFVRQPDGSLRVDGVGIFADPLCSTVWPRDIAVTIKATMPSVYSMHTYGSLGLGLRPSVHLRGWCTHMTEADLEAGRFTVDELHPGSSCPELFYEVSWSNRFVVKLTKAHRLLGCKPHQTRALLHDMMYKKYIDDVEWLEAELEAEQRLSYDD